MIRYLHLLFLPLAAGSVYLAWSVWQEGSRLMPLVFGLLTLLLLAAIPLVKKEQEAQQKRHRDMFGRKRRPRKASQE